MCALLLCWGALAEAQMTEEPLPEDYQAFMQGFTAYQQKEFNLSSQRLNAVLEQYPDTPLRDVTLFWLACANFKSGRQNLAVRYLSQLSREYPDTPLRGLAEEELNRLAIRYDLGEKAPIATIATTRDAS